MTRLLRHLRKAVDPSEAAGVRDAELLERFVQNRDEAAFELLVWRHQRMVLGVCRRVLGDRHDAEDAFQAVFLVLARKAAALGQRQAVAGWLHTVAYRIALRARAGRRKKTDLDLATLESLDDPAENALRRDLAAALDEEIYRLPAKYRLAVVLCYLEGKTYPEVGRQLGLALGTVAGRLARARTLLRTRLLRRGIDLSGAAFVTWLGEQTADAATPTALVNGTARAAARIATGRAAIPATVAALTEEALRIMLVSKLKMAAALLLAGLLVAGMGALVPAALISTSAVIETPPPSTSPAEGKSETVRVDRQGDALPAGALFCFGSVRLRHDSSICASALSPDGKILATTSGRSVVLWDLAAGKPLRRFVTDDHGHFCTPGIAFSPDGRYLGYVQCLDFACLWNVQSGEQVAKFIGDMRHPFALCQFTPDGKEFILEDEKRVVFWDVRANKETRSVRIERVPLLSPDARTCLRFEGRQALSMVDAQSGAETQRLEVSAAHNGVENGIAFAPDGKSLAVVHQNKEIQVRDFPAGKQQASFPLPDSARHRNANEDHWEYQLGFSTDGRTLLLGTRSGLVHRWDLATRKELPPLSKHQGAVAGVHTLPDGKTIVTTGADGLIRRWDRETGRELAEPPGYMGRTHAIYSSDGRYAVIGDARGRLELWDARNGHSLRILQGEGSAITKLTFTPKGRLLAAAHADNTVHLWTLPAGEEPRILRCDKEHDLTYVWNMRFSPDGRRLLIMDHNYRARLWELSSGTVCWKKHFGAAEFSPDGKTLAMVYDGPYLNLLDASDGKTHARLRLDTNTPERIGNAPAIAFSPDGQRLALGMNGVFVCDTRTGAKIHHFQAADLPKGIHDIERRQLQITGEGGVHGLAFSPDGRWLCTSGRDGSVRLWEVVTGREVLRRDGHTGDVKQVAFGLDSRTVLSCGEDSQAYLWSLRPPKEEANASLDSLWSALAAEPTKAYRAIWAMSEREDSCSFLQGKLAPAQPVMNERLTRLIADLDSDQFAVREAAGKALAALGAIATPAVREALRNNPSLEARKRLEELIRLAEKKTLSPEDLRAGRAIDVLERLATAEARALLKLLADGAPEALTTTAARAALKRLGR